MLDFQSADAGTRDEANHESQIGACRCCLAWGRFKPMDHVNTEAPAESCADMLHSTFCIAFELPEDGPAEGANLICDACETRLRDAHTFRHQVINAQINFILQNRAKILSVSLERLDIRSFMNTTPQYEVPLVSIVSDEEIDDGDDYCINTIPQAKPKNLDYENTVPFNKTKRRTTTAGSRKRIRNRQRPKIESTDKKKPTVQTNNNNSSYNGNSKKNNETVEIKCKFCEMMFPPLYREVWKHLKTEHDVEEIKKPDTSYLECDYCATTFSSCKKKVTHLQRKHYKCRKCPEIFRNVYERQEHARTHRLPCNICNESFISSLALRYHKRLIHKFKCKECTKIFNSETVHNRHMVQVHGAPRYVCGACDKTFDLKTALHTHKRRDHLMERNYKCTICDYTGFSSTYFRNHMYTHSVVKNFMCTFCCKKFSHPKTLKNHVRIHTGEKRQVCKLCGAAFVQRASLKYHLEKYHPNDD